jgi:hypothetical protein
MQRTSKIKILIFTLVVLSIIFLFSCKIDKPTYSEFHPLEGKIIFNLIERYENYNEVGDPKIMLSMRTEKIYPCFNYSIITEVLHLGKEISVVISGVYIPNVCLTALGPARYQTFLDLSVGEYLLSFSYRGAVDQYVLKVSDSSIEIACKDSSFTRLQFPLFWRYPPKSFAYLCGTATETKWICDDFLDTLQSNIKLEEFQFPDSGVIPYPTSSMGYYSDMPAKYFLYEKEEDFDDAIELLERYSQEVIVNYKGVGVSLINWRNKNYGSWY